MRRNEKILYLRVMICIALSLRLQKFDLILIDNLVIKCNFIWFKCALLYSSHVI